MDKETEEKINRILEKIIHYLLYEVREASGEFPYRMRIDCFFSRNEGSSSHFMEKEFFLSKELIEMAENTYQDYVKKEIIKSAADILKGIDTP